MATTSFQTTIDAEQYFKGLARQSMDCHHALGELIDNAMSARHRDEFSGSCRPGTVEITAVENENGTYTLQVADHGVGIRYSELTGKVFNPGGQGETRGILNEHGFGLKNALALLTGGNSTHFELLTRSAADAARLDPDRFYCVTGPLSTTMEVRDDATRDEWGKDLHLLGTAATGTKVRVTVQGRYFRTLYKRGAAGFDVLMRRLGEHVGVTHREFIRAGNRIRLAYRSVGNEWTHKEMPAIGILVCKSFTSVVQDAVASVNQRKDAAGNPYRIELKTIDDILPRIR